MHLVKLFHIAHFIYIPGTAQTLRVRFLVSLVSSYKQLLGTQQSV